MTDQEFNRLLAGITKLVDDGATLNQTVANEHVLPVATLCCLQQIAAGMVLLARVVHDLDRKKGAT